MFIKFNFLSKNVFIDGIYDKMSIIIFEVVKEYGIFFFFVDSLNYRIYELYFGIFLLYKNNYE